MREQGAKHNAQKPRSYTGPARETLRLVSIANVMKHCYRLATWQQGHCAFHFPDAPLRFHLGAMTAFHLVDKCDTVISFPISLPGARLG